VAEAGTSRQDWVAAAMTLLARGISPDDMDVPSLCQAMPHPVTKGSFNWHFRSGRLAALHQEVISSWLAARAAAAGKARGERDPLQRLRVLHGAALGSGAADSAMRRWAAARPRPGRNGAGYDVHRQLSAAIAQVDDLTAVLLAEALTDLGLPGGEAAAVAATLAAAFAAGPPAPASPDGFEALLAVLRRAADPGTAPTVRLIAGDTGDVLLVLAERDLPPAQFSALRAAAQASGGQARTADSAGE